MKHEILTAFTLSAVTLAVCVCCFWLVNRPRTLIDDENVLIRARADGALAGGNGHLR